MKKVIIALSAVALLSTAIYVGQVRAAESVKVSVVGDFDSVMRCRCKHGGCYGGNAISFRAACAKGSLASDCSGFAVNCRNSDL